MKEQTTKGNHGASQGKLQFLAHQKLIKQKLALGYTLTAIYKELCENKQLSISYTNFARYKVMFLGYSITVNKKKKHKKNTSDQVAPKETEQTENNNTFINENKAMDDLV